jgi:competence protein ComEC
MKHTGAFWRTHPALWVSGLFAGGIALSFELLGKLPPAALWGLLCALGLLTVPARRVYPKLFVPLVVLLVWAAGLTYGTARFSFVSPNDIRLMHAQNVRVMRGHVVQAHYRLNGKNRYVIRLTQVKIDSQWRRAQGNVWLYTAKELPALRYGQRIEWRSSLKEPPLPRNPGQFNYRRYLNLKGIFYVSYAEASSLHILPGNEGAFWQRFILEPLRVRVRNIMNRFVRPPTRDILKALILGERQDLNREIYTEFQKTGVVHVLAISGLHVGFILLIFLTFFGIFPFSRKLRYGLSFLMLGLFVALVNFKAPVVRASLMALLYFGVPLLQRRTQPLNILGVAALVILLVDPAQLFLPGFQFSFAAVGGILYGFPVLKEKIAVPAGKTFWYRFANHWIIQPLLVSFCAILGTLPLTWWYYGVIQLGALIINVFVIPLIGLLVIGAFLFVIVGFFNIPVLYGFAFLLERLTLFILKLVHWFSIRDWVQWRLPHPSTIQIVLLGLLLVLAFQWGKSKQARIWGAAVFLWLMIAFWPQTTSNLRVTFMDVGQGDACLVQFPRNINVLVDAGDRSRWRDYGRQVVVPLLHYYGIKHLRYAVVTHSHRDHFGGMFAVLQNVRVDTLVVNSYPDTLKSYQRFLALAKSKGIPVLLRRRGHTLNVGKNARAYILSPVPLLEKLRTHGGREINNTSLVIEIVYGQTKFLLTGDAQREAEGIMAGYGTFLRSAILKVGHHGSATSSSADFLQWVQPKFSVISVGERNHFHHPSPLTISRLFHLGSAVLRTDRIGAVVFVSDGFRVRRMDWRN